MHWHWKRGKVFQKVCSKDRAFVGKSPSGDLLRQNKERSRSGHVYHVPWGSENLEMPNSQFIVHVLNNLTKDYKVQVTKIQNRVGHKDDPLMVEDMRDKFCLCYKKKCMNVTAMMTIRKKKKKKRLWWQLPSLRGSVISVVLMATRERTAHSFGVRKCRLTEYQIYGTWVHNTPDQTDKQTNKNRWTDIRQLFMFIHISDLTRLINTWEEVD